MKVICLVVSVFIVLSTLQLHAQVIPSFLNESYMTLGDPNLILQRPADSYQSLRIRSLSQAFTGLIQDDYTDHFLNPAFQINSTSGELFGDYATEESRGNFLVGSSFNINENSFGAYIDMEKLADNSRIQSYSYYPTATPVLNYDNGESLQRFWGGSLTYSTQYSEKSRMGLAYQYRESDDNYNYVYGGGSNPTSMYFREYTTQGNFHKINAGLLNNFLNSTLSTVLSGVFASYTWNELYERFSYQSSSNTNYTYNDSPANVISNGVMASITYRTKINENLNRSFLLEIGYTGYNVEGKATLLDTSNYNGSSSKTLVKKIILK